MVAGGRAAGLDRELISKQLFEGRQIVAQSPVPPLDWVYAADLPKAGRYRVALSYGPNPNRAGNVSIRIRHADGESTLTVNQKAAPSGDKPFHPLGTFDFKSGREGWVEIINAGSDGYVIVDAVQWLPTGE